MATKKKAVKKSKCDCKDKSCTDCNPRKKPVKKGGCCGCCK